MSGILDPSVLNEFPRLEMPIWTLLVGHANGSAKTHDDFAVTTKDSSKFVFLFTDCHQAVQSALNSIWNGASLLPEPLASHDRVTEVLKKCDSEGVTHVLLNANSPDDSSRCFPIKEFIQEFEKRAQEQT